MNDGNMNDGNMNDGNMLVRGVSSNMEPSGNDIQNKTDDINIVNKAAIEFFESKGIQPEYLVKINEILKEYHKMLSNTGKGSKKPDPFYEFITTYTNINDLKKYVDEIKEIANSIHSNSNMILSKKIYKILEIDEAIKLPSEIVLSEGVVISEGVELTEENKILLFNIYSCVSRCKLYIFIMFIVFTLLDKSLIHQMIVGRLFSFRSSSGDVSRPLLQLAKSANETNGPISQLLIYSKECDELISKITLITTLYEFRNNLKKTDPDFQG